MVCRHERGGVEQNVPAFAPRLGDPLERVLDAGKVRLRRVGKKVVPPASCQAEVLFELGVVHSHLRQSQRNIGDLGLFGTGKFANAVHRIVIVERQQKMIALAEGVGFSDQLERGRGVRREDRGVLPRRGVEIVENRAPGLFHQPGHGSRRRVAGMRIAEKTAFEKLDMLADLARGVESAAGVVQIRVVFGVEVGIVARAQAVKSPCLLVLGIGGEKLSFGLLEAGARHRRLILNRGLHELTRRLFSA